MLVELQVTSAETTHTNVCIIQDTMRKMKGAMTKCMW